jgi:hypothetical protein
MTDYQPSWHSSVLQCLVPNLFLDAAGLMPGKSFLRGSVGMAPLVAASAAQIQKGLRLWAVQVIPNTTVAVMRDKRIAP